MAAPDPHRDLLERATVALERIERTADRQAQSFDRQAEMFDRQAQAFDRQAQAFDRQGQAFDRQGQAFDRLIQRLDEDRVESRVQHERLMRRFERSENLFVAAISEVGKDIQRNTDRLDEIGERIRDMGEAIRANTQAVLSVLDRLGPAPG